MCVCVCVYTINNFTIYITYMYIYTIYIHIYFINICKFKKWIGGYIRSMAPNFSSFSFCNPKVSDV